MNLLAIVAHPDDAELFIGGTLAKHADRGDDVTIAYMTRGEYGGFDVSESEVAATREAEARAGADLLGADATFLDFEDGRVTYSLENRLRIVDCLREHEPDIVITHFDDDMHPDHRRTAELVTDAYYMSSLSLCETEHEPHDPDNVYYFGKASSSFDPSIVVDVTGYVELKKEALLCHESQVDFLERHGGIDAEFTGLLENLEAEARVLGKTRGVEFAEGFTCLHDGAVEYLD
ncbi:PIG-L deacetylase family protein [Haloarchaeobius sp. TZWSO28]|uniref:PIG-L deacetylase family protein n=1 Tax=Haloarchaeobius sp. TZWSO28 TaxID=3446119 RepID=UPI003EB7D9A6